MDQKAEFGERLCAAMLRAGYAVRPIVLEHEFNSRYWGRSVTLQAVRRWLRGEAIPSQDKLQVLAEWLKVEPQVLRFGEKTVLSVQAAKKRWEENIGHQERELFEAFLGLPSTQRKVLREVILTFAKAYAESNEDK